MNCRHKGICMSLYSVNHALDTALDLTSIKYIPLMQLKLTKSNLTSINNKQTLSNLWNYNKYFKLILTQFIFYLLKHLLTNMVDWQSAKQDLMGLILIPWYWHSFGCDLQMKSFNCFNLNLPHLGMSIPFHSFIKSSW